MGGTLSLYDITPKTRGSCSRRPLEKYGLAPKTSPREEFRIAQRLTVTVRTSAATATAAAVAASAATVRAATTSRAVVAATAAVAAARSGVRA